MRIIFLLLLPAFVIPLLPAALQADDGTPFTIGMILPLSGPPADYGDAMRKAADLAISDRPANFSGVKLIYEDPGYDVKLAVQAFKKLHTVDKVDLIYVWGSTFCKAISPMAESFQAPMVNQCTDRESGRGKRFVVRFMNYSDQLAARLHEYLREKKLKRIGVVLSDNPYAEEIFNNFSQQASPDQQVTVIDRFPVGQYELRSTLAKIRASSYDVVGIFLGLGQIAQFYRQRREQNLDFPTFGTNFFESASEIKASGRTMDGAVYASNKVREDFIRRYSEKYGKPTQLAYAALTYEFITLSGELFNNQGGLAPLKVLEKLTSVAPRRGIATGSYSYKETPYAGRFFDFELAMKEVQGEFMRQLE